MPRAIEGRSPAAMGDRLTEARRRFASPAVKAAIRRRAAEFLALFLVIGGIVAALGLASYDPSDPSFSTATSRPTANLLGPPGAHAADILLQGVGFAAWLPVACLMTWAWRLAMHKGLQPFVLRLACLLAALPLLAASLSLLPLPAGAPAHAGPGGAAGPAVAEFVLERLGDLLGTLGEGMGHLIVFGVTVLLAFIALGLSLGEWRRAGSAAGAVAATAAVGAGRAARIAAEGAQRSGFAARAGGALAAPYRALAGLVRRRREATPALSDLLRRADQEAEAEAPAGAVHRRKEPAFGAPIVTREAAPADAAPAAAPQGAGLKKPPAPKVAPPTAAPKPSPVSRQGSLDLPDGNWRFPPLSLLSPAPVRRGTGPSEEALQGNARMLETVLEDYGVRGRIAEIRPGPVVTLYELEPAPGTKSARVIGLADDIARSMSVTAVRIATVPGRNVIGIELPERQARDGAARRDVRAPRTGQATGAADPRARQGHRRRAGDRRPRADAAPADRGHHRLGQVGRDQHHDPVAALALQPGGVPLHHDRPEDAGAVGLRPHPAPLRPW
jgi:S-DNA-T family DNA segregation ATPase FtsK/SpoIIIE